MVVVPCGEVISDTLCESEGLLYQDVDISLCVEPKQFHDVAGYYNRFDVFNLNAHASGWHRSDFLTKRETRHRFRHHRRDRFAK
jgi:aliphatic nitrilase